MSWRDWWRNPPPPIPVFESGVTFKNFTNKDLPDVVPVIPTPHDVSITRGVSTRNVIMCLTDIAAKLNDRDWLKAKLVYRFCSVVFLCDEEVAMVLTELKKQGWLVEWEYKHSAGRHFFALTPGNSE